MKHSPCQTQPDGGVPFLTAGEGETVLLLHGSTGNAGTWRQAIAALSPLYRVIAPDLIGYGKSAPVQPGIGPTLADEAARLRSLLPCCNKPLHLVGYSYGGVVALHMALTETYRIRSLTLIEPVFFSALRYDSRTADYDTFTTIRDRFSTDLASGNTDSAMEHFIDFWNGAGAWRGLPPAIRLQLAAMAHKIQMDWQAAFAIDPGAKALWKLADKTLLLSGDASPAPMQQLVASLSGFIPGACQETVAGANHLLPLTHGDAMVAAITAHLHRSAERRLR